MNVRDFMKSQFIEIIEWLDDGKDIIIFKFPDEDREIKMNAQLTVRESQVALFLNEGVLADVFLPGRYELTTRNIPVLSRLRGWRHGFNSPFKADVYFVNTKQFIGKKWGTANPVVMRDPDLGLVRLRSFGSYGFRITDAPLFFKEIAGTNGIYTTDGVYNHFRSKLVSAFSDIVGRSKIPVVELVGNYASLGRNVLEEVKNSFAQIGVSVSSFVVENIALPPDVEKYVDKKSAMGVIGDMKQYTDFQVADSIPDAAANPGGVAGISAGFIMGKKIADAMTEPERKEPALSSKSCSHCKEINPVQAKFCTGCGKSLISEDACRECQIELPQGAKYCFSCGKAIERGIACPKCGTLIKENASFCIDCGTQKPK